MDDKDIEQRHPMHSTDALPAEKNILARLGSTLHPFARESMKARAAAALDKRVADLNDNDPVHAHQIALEHDRDVRAKLTRRKAFRRVPNVVDFAGGRAFGAKGADVAIAHDDEKMSKVVPGFAKFAAANGMPAKMTVGQWREKMRQRLGENESK